MPFKDYRDQSRNTGWGSYQDANLSIEQINCGSLLRIADATELMAKRYNELIESRDYWKKTAEENEEVIKHLDNKIRGLRGAITKLKNKAV